MSDDTLTCKTCGKTYAKPVAAPADAPIWTECVRCGIDASMPGSPVEWRDDIEALVLAKEAIRRAEQAGDELALARARRHHAAIAARC